MGSSKRITGYRLHKERLLFSGGDVVRTIKFPLVSFDQESEEVKDFLRKFEEAVIADDLRIRGDLNINDYLSYTAKDNRPYTLFDFWEDSLLAGVIWMPKTSELIDFLTSEYKLVSPIDSIWSKALPRITKFFEKEKFKGILKSDPVRSRSTKKSFYLRIVSYLKEDYLTSNGKIYEVTSPEAKKEIDFIVNSFFDERGNLLLDGNQQYEFWKTEYGLDKSLIESAKPQGRYSDITFVIIPDLISDLNSEINLDVLIRKREEWLGDRKDMLQSILGLSNNFNGFSNFFGKALYGLQAGDIEELYNAQSFILPIIEERKDKVLDSLGFLSNRSIMLGKTSLYLINGWHEYRSVFGGKLQSWFTNSQKRKYELDGQVSNFKLSLDQAIEYLKTQEFIVDAEKEKKDILDLLLLLEEFFKDDKKSIKNEENYQIFNSLWSLVKRRLNFFYQAYIKKEGDEINVNNFDAFKGLYERIYKPVAFYGDSSRRANEKFVNKTIPILEDGIENVVKLISYLKESFSVLDTFDKVGKERETAESFYRRHLQFFWNKYSEGSVNSAIFKKKYEEILKENVIDSDWEKLQGKLKKGGYVFYKSPYSKGTIQEVKIIDSADYLVNLENNVSLLIDFLLSFAKDDLLNDVKLLLDWVELSKNIVSLLLRFNKKDKYEIKDLILDNFVQAKRYIDVFGRRDYSRNEFSFIIQSLIFSEIRGSATLYSKREYIAKYTVQVVGADSKFKLYYLPKDDDIVIKKEIVSLSNYSEERRQLMKPHSYLVSVGKLREKSKSDIFNSLALTKDKGLVPVFLPEDSKKFVFRLSSSPYQLQFLDKFIYRPRGWENVDIKLNEWSFVVERKYKVEWDLDFKKPKFLPLVDKENRVRSRIFLSVPFTLIPSYGEEKTPPLKEIAKGQSKSEKDLSRLDYPILGVDVGEYGLAYCLVKFSYDKSNYDITGISLLKDREGEPICGFIEDRNIAKIKDRFAEIQQKAKEGSFEEEDNIVSMVRENAIGSLRNRVHYVVTQGNSSVVYEDSISNFETGSGRTTKIYNSVKRADTELQTEADKKMHNHVWGNGAKLVGRSVSAYASSYTCVNCLHSLYQIRKDDLEKIEIVNKEGRIVYMTSPYGDIKGYVSKNDNYNKGYRFKNTDKDLKSFRKIVEDFARPPVSKDCEVVNKYAKNLLDGNKIEEFRKGRGNSAIFVCPFCQFVADADIQAAFMMALRGYLRFSGLVPSSSNSSKGKIEGGDMSGTTGGSFLENTIKQLRDINKSDIISSLSVRF